MTSEKMSEYALRDSQWEFAEHLVPVLELFNDLTNVFSQAEVPLVYEVVPMLESLEYALDHIYNANDDSPPIVRIAAKAALQIIGKYYALMDDNEEAKRIIRAQWTVSYATLVSSVPTKAPDPPAPQPRHTPSKWAAYNLSDEEDGEINFTCQDSIEAYLDSLRVSRTEVNAAGGVLQYWENTSPASSVDAKWVFSSGHLLVNHLQHDISSQTFKAQVAIRSWFNTPLMPDLNIATKIMQRKMGKEKGLGEGKGKEDSYPDTIDIDSD
ncbi:hypothetical protein CY34DRAFT_18172 [Suillus luteus UH-Slu-Lm8-n1]|uniref:Uncharacterized protein n=1 Tax=Suillus luteus UH-Slu-Lm8-n1 TaxID=930992 RepID=A0A0D0AP28_9AGAM|nr:hypothetical protein CY34DRAFT_18172 [Suillus luteus UH-Slu-Lm8-n1]